QGEASSESFKLACPRHVDCVKRLCRTVHVTINARSESNLDWNEIVTKVQNLTGSVSHTQPTNSNNTDDEFVPTGSVYVRANPNKDIPKGCVSRSIWQSQQEKQNDSSKLRSPVKVLVG
ncbi:putative dbnl-prov protein, partial [Schistosoma mansoni]|uniref:putative dbnl-prov protein n=1 Tax=Schistosoma mansoni TaxID=6183 RepID=UPI0001A625E7